MSEFQQGYHPPQPDQPRRRRRSAQYDQPEYRQPAPPPPPVEQPMAPNNRFLASQPVAEPPRMRPREGDASFFDGGLLQQIGYAILGALVTVLTLGICYPWALCMQYRWRIKHTVIEGRRLAFDGRATQLVGKWILWLLLTIITFGIYAFWVGIALEKWKVKHTHFAD